jgi:membrane-associated HD superfamily phosphohydrolase
METPVSEIEILIAKAEVYGKTSFDLAKLKSIETSAIIASTVLSRLSFIIAITLFTIFVNVGVALLVGDAIGKTYYGFFIVALFYLITGIVFYFFLNKWIKKPIADLIITQTLQ